MPPFGAAVAVIVVTSVPHTGSQFVTQHLLAGAGLSSPNDFYFQHVEDTTVPLMRKLMRDGWPCIVPMRHPSKVAGTWTGRGLELYTLRNYWRRLILAIDPLGPLYLPIDVPNRQDYLDLINEATCLDLKTDWPVTGSTGLSPAFDTHKGSEMKLVEGMFDELGDFFGRFGYEL